MTDTPKFKARPTVYKGIKMRSRLEAGYAMWLDRWRADWTYEPCAFGSQAGQYLPDFRIDGLRCAWRGEPTTAYVEVKPKAWPYWGQGNSTDEFEALMSRMGIIWESEPGAVLLLAQPAHTVELNDADACFQLVWVLQSDPFEGGDPWPSEGVWIGSCGHLGVAIPLGNAGSPWPDGYWKGPQ